MAAQTQTRRILISVDTKGNQAIKQLADSLGGISKNTKSLSQNLRGLTSAFQGWLAYLGVREVVRMSDEMQNLNNRLKLVSRSTEDTGKVMRDLLALADETKQSVGDLGSVYVRMATSLKQANASTESLLALTKTLVNTFRLSSATAQETTSTIIQLSQAFSSGQLRGQELRSVMEQNSYLALLLKERFGQDIYKKAEAGAIRITDVLIILRDNMEKINEQAKTLTPTFEQTLTKSFNKFQYALLQLNEKFDLAGKFARFMDELSLAVVVLFDALRSLGDYLSKNEFFQDSTIAIVGLLAVMNPLTAAVVATGAAIYYTTDSLGAFVDKIRNLGSWIVQLRLWILELTFALEKGLAKALFTVGLGTDDMINNLALKLDQINELTTTALGLSQPKYRPSPLDPNAGLKNQRDEIQKLIDAFQKLQGAGKIPKIKDILAEINKELIAGNIELDEYNRKLVNFELYKVNREFAEGKFDVFQYNERMAALKKQDFNRMFKEGALSLEQFNDKIRSLEIDNLNAKFEAGRISLKEYDETLISISQKFEAGSALRSGTEQFVDSIGTISSNVADAIKATFSSLEDALVDFVKTGKFNFADFTKAVLDDLTRIIIRASIIRPLATGILNAAYGSSNYSGTTTDATGGGFDNYSAKGNVFDKGLKKFAKGGVVSSPTMFGYGGGGKGLMGEAGAEAILPLQRGKGGNLGVAATVTPVTVNIINQSGTDVQQKETTGPNGEKTIEVLITGKVREGIISGKFDRAMSSAYGLNRKGS